MTVSATESLDDRHQQVHHVHIWHADVHGTAAASPFSCVNCSGAGSRRRQSFGLLLFCTLQHIVMVRRNVFSTPIMLLFLYSLLSLAR